MEKIKAFVHKFTPYLDEIRKRVYSTAVIFCIFFFIGFAFTGKILKIIISAFDLKDVVIATTSPFQFADLSINIGLLTAFVVVCPIIAYHLVDFLRPALTNREKALVISIFPLALILFVIGFSYGFFIMYYALIILAGLNKSIGISNIWDIGTFLSQILLTSTLLGVLFQFPIVISFMIRMNIFDVDELKKRRRLAVLIIVIFTSLLPPTDGLSLLAMTLPLILLYEITIFVNSWQKSEFYKYN